MHKLVLVLIMLLAGCNFFEGFGAAVGDCADAGVKYTAPDYVDIVEASCVPGLGPGNAAYEALFKIPPSRLAEFQATTGLTEWTDDKTQARIFAEEAESSGSVLVSTYGDGAYLREVVIDTSDPNEHTVYYYHAYVD